MIQRNIRKVITSNVIRIGKQLEGQKTENLLAKEVETDSENKVVEYRPGEEKQEEKGKPVNESIVYPPPPFQQRIQKQKLDKQFAKLLEVFKKLHINIPFAEAIEQMPSYAKFMKGILSRKKKLKDFETVA